MSKPSLKKQLEDALSLSKALLVVAALLFWVAMSHAFQIIDLKRELRSAEAVVALSDDLRERDGQLVMAEDYVLNAWQDDHFYQNQYAGPYGPEPGAVLTVSAFTFIDILKCDYTPGWTLARVSGTDMQFVLETWRVPGICL